MHPYIYGRNMHAKRDPTGIGAAYGTAKSGIGIAGVEHSGRI